MRPTSSAGLGIVRDARVRDARVRDARVRDARVRDARVRVTWMLRCYSTVRAHSCNQDRVFLTT